MTVMIANKIVYAKKSLKEYKPIYLGIEMINNKDSSLYYFTQFLKIKSMYITYVTWKVETIYQKFFKSKLLTISCPKKEVFRSLAQCKSATQSSLRMGRGETIRIWEILISFTENQTLLRKETGVSERIPKNKF